MTVAREAPPSDTAKNSRRVFEDLCDTIRRDIASGALKPGDRLPAERELAEAHGIGRNAVREALRTLEIAGVVRLQKGRNGGPYIRAPNVSRVTHAMRDLIDYGTLGWKDLTEARSRVLEIVMELAAERATPADYAALEHNLDLTDEAQSESRREAIVDHAYEFWTLLATSTHNTVLVLLVKSMSDLLSRFVETASEVEVVPPLPSLVPARRKMLQHLRAGDVDHAIAELKIQLRKIHVRIHARIARGEEAARAAASTRTARTAASARPAKTAPVAKTGRSRKA